MLKDCELIKIEGLLGLTFKGQEILMVNIYENIHTAPLLEESFSEEEIFDSGSKFSEDEQNYFDDNLMSKQLDDSKPHHSMKMSETENVDEMEENTKETQETDMGKKQTWTRNVQESEGTLKLSTTSQNQDFVDDSVDGTGESEHMMEDEAAVVSDEQGSMVSDEQGSTADGDAQNVEDKGGSLSAIQKEEVLPLSCGLCDVKTKCLSDWRQHMKQTHKRLDGPGGCTLCNRHYKRSACLASHLKDLHDSTEADMKLTPSRTKYIKCDICQTRFKCERYLRNHVKKLHSDMVESSMQKCPHCDRKFAFEANLMYHLRDEHGVTVKDDEKEGNMQPLENNDEDGESPSLPMQCVTCDEIFPTPKHISLHVKAEHLQSEQHPVLKCLECEKSYKGLPSLRSHLSDDHRHDAGEALECPICLKDFRVRRYLMDHLNNAHKSSDDHFCSECGRYFKYMRNLKRHLEVAHDKQLAKSAKPKEKQPSKKMYQCATCRKEYKSHANFKLHMQEHTGEYAFPCTLCPQKFKLKSRLEVHMRKHRGEKPFVCSRCGKGFYRKGNVRQHEALCGQEEVWNYCEDCGSEFRTIKTYKHHMLQNHGRRLVPRPDLGGFEEHFEMLENRAPLMYSNDSLSYTGAPVLSIPNDVGSAGDNQVDMSDVVEQLESATKLEG